jgi:hypothetical protein
MWRQRGHAIEHLAQLVRVRHNNIIGSDVSHGHLRSVLIELARHFERKSTQESHALVRRWIVQHQPLSLRVAESWTNNDHLRFSKLN